MSSFKSFLFCPQTEKTKKISANFVGQKYLLLAKYNFFDPVPWVLGTLCHLSWEKKHFSGTCFVYGYSLYVNGKYKNKAGKEGRKNIFERSNHNSKRNSRKVRKSRVVIIAMLCDNSLRHRNTSWACQATGGISLLAGVSTLQGFYWFIIITAFCDIFKFSSQTKSKIMLEKVKKMEDRQDQITS